MLHNTVKLLPPAYAVNKFLNGLLGNRRFGCVSAIGFDNIMAFVIFQVFNLKGALKLEFDLLQNGIIASFDAFNVFWSEVA